MKRKLFIVLLVLSFIALPLMVACAQEAPVPVPAPAPAPAPVPAPAPAPAPASEDPEAFYKDKVLTFAQYFDMGSGEDLAIRAMAPYIVKNTGARAMDIISMTGAGGIEAINKVYSAKPDGLTLGMAEVAGMALDSIFQINPASKYKTEDFQYVFGFPRVRQFQVVREGGAYDTVEKLNRATDLRIGTYSNLVGNFNMTQYTIAKAFNLEGTMISGMGGSKRILLLQRDELDITILDTDRISQIRDSELPLKALMVMAPERHPYFPEIPTVRELVPNPSADLLSMIEFSENAMPRMASILAPPGTPDDRLAFLEKAFVAAGDEAIMLIEMALEVEVKAYLTRSDIEDTIQSIMAPDGQARLKDLFDPLITQFNP